MSTHEDHFLESLRETFKVEANEHLEILTDGLQALDRPITVEKQQPIVDRIFRAAHSLKGAARAVNFGEIESVCQALENIFGAWKRRDRIPSAEDLELIQLVLDAVASEISDPTRESRQVLSAHIHALRNLSLEAPVVTDEPDIKGPVDTPPPITAPPVLERASVVETVRVPIAKLDTQLLEAEEMLAAKLVMQQRAAELRDLIQHLHEWRTELERVQPAVRAIRSSMDRRVQSTEGSTLKELAEFVEWNHDYFRALETKATALRRSAAQDSLLVGKLVDDLLEDSKKLLMLPVSTLSGFLQRLVRDLCRDEQKQADLVITGEEVEIDKRVLEEMKDPLIHLIRNAIDHGLEKPELRQQRGKPARATISLKVLPLNGDKVELIVSDDGMGIDLAKVKESAVKQGVISSQDANRITETEALQLVLRPDISTSPMITELSGRGLGLAIVREQTEKLGGQAFVESAPQAGTTIRMTLPIALRTFRGILVEAGKQLFVVPTAQVERVASFKTEDVQTVEGRETVTLNDQAVGLCRLSDVLELPPTEAQTEISGNIQVLILGNGDEQLAFAVEAVIDEQEVLVKRLAKPLERVRNVAGATVLGSGHVTPVLSVPDLLKSARRSARSATNLAKPEAQASKPISVLLVEDSITSRMLLKGILESAGYEVATAVDGMDAFTILRTRPIDLVISDVEMPRLNGFDLTAKIRADTKLSELPVVLVTALESREDRERGIEVGANAYLVKSSFDQSNLLEAVRRLS